MNIRLALVAAAVALGMASAIMITIRRERRENYCAHSRDRYRVRNSAACFAELDSFSANDKSCIGDYHRDFDQNDFNRTMALCSLPLRVPVKAMGDRSEEILPGAPADFVVEALAATAPDDVWAGGTSLYHYDGVSWSPVKTPFAPIRGLAARGESDVWMIGYNANVAHFDGAHWSSVRVPGLGAAQAIQAWRDVVWIVDQQGFIYAFDGERWTRRPGPPGQLRTFWGSSSHDVWGATKSGIAHWDGAEWSTQWFQAPVTAIGGTAPDDVWMTGPEVTTFHWDGHRWTPQRLSRNMEEKPALRGVSAWRRDNVAVIGDDGSFARYASFERMSPGADWSPLGTTADAWRTVLVPPGADEVLLAGAGPRVVRVH